MTRPTFELGGWSQPLSREPMPHFTQMMYAMVTNLDGLTTGTASTPGWSPATGSCTIATPAGCGPMPKSSAIWASPWSAPSPMVPGPAN